MEAQERENQILEMHQLALTHYQSGALDDALALMRQVVLQYADLEAEGVSLLRRNTVHKQRAFACEQCADMLLEREAYPEAANLYQEAVDVFITLNDPEATQHIEECAHKAVLAINSLRAKPQDRLKLLIARYERRLQQLRLHSGTTPEQAQIVFEIAQVYQRRERFSEAVEQYKIALQLFEQGNPDAENALKCAECHHQLGNLARYLFQEIESAWLHYRAAVRLFNSCTELEAYDPSARAMCLLALQEIEARFPEDTLPSHEGRSGF